MRDPRSVSFSPDAQFWDVEGVPVCFDLDDRRNSGAWGREGVRWFDPGSRDRNGVPITKADFLDLVDEVRGSRKSPE